METLRLLLDSITQVQARLGPSHTGSRWAAGPLRFRLAWEMVWKDPCDLSSGLCPLCSLKVAQADAGSEELVKSSGAEGEGVQGQRRSPPHAGSPLTAESLPPARSPVTLDSALWAVRAAIQRRRQREQVGTETARLRRASMGLPMTLRRLTPRG